MVVAAPAGSELADAVAVAGAEVVPWNATRSPGPSVVSETRRLLRAVGDARPDLVHLHSSKAGLAGRLAVRGRRPTVFQPHSWSFDAVDGPVRSAAIAWERFGARWAQAIVCVSEGERERGSKHRIVGHFRVIPNGVDLTAFAEAGAADRVRARATLGLTAAPLVVCVGRLCRQKGQDRLIATWPAVRALVPGASLALVGTGEDEAALRQQAAEGVQLVGYRTDVATWLAAADVVALPSRWEGMALGLLEAMASGRSVVATDVPGAREAIGETAGAVVPCSDPPALAEALCRRLLDRPLADAEGAEGRARAERSHDVRRTASAVADLYAELTRR